MSAAPIRELVVPYDPGPLLDKVARRRRLVRSRLLSLVITVAVLVGLYLWQRDELSGPGFVTVYALVFAISLGWVAASVLLFVRARQEASRVGEGTAIRIGPSGVQVGSLTAGWQEVSALGTVNGGLGRGARLRLLLHDGRQAELPLEQVTVFPATLDSTARAFSGGRHGVDLSALDT